MVIRRIIIALIMLMIAPAVSWAGAVGTAAPGFTLEDGTGRAVSLDEFRGRVVFINFWASWCAPCKKEFPELASFISAHDPAKAVVLAINIDKKRSHADDFLSRAGKLPANMLVLYDPKAAVVSKYRAAAMPTSFILDGSGVIRYIHFGYKEDSPMEWAAEFEALLGEGR